MRIFIALLFLFPLACRAEDNGSVTLFNACEAVANNTLNEPAQLYRTGFLRGIIPVVYKVHAFYEDSFPNLTYPIKDPAIVSRWSATGILLGNNICLPDNIHVQTVALILRKYGREHPEKLSESEYKFVNEALFFSFSCKKP